MSEVYIRNANRGRKVIANKYEPEYKKRQMIPVEYPIKDEQEFVDMNRKIQAKQAQELHQAQKIQELQELQQEQEQELEAQGEVRESQQFVASGQGEEVLWNKSIESLPERQPAKFKVVAEQSYEDVNAPIKASEIVRKPERLYDAPAQSTEELENDLGESSFDMDSVPVDEYVLVYDGKVLNIGTISAVKETLTSILMDEANGEVSIEDFLCFKRVPLRMGLFINNE